MCNLLNGSEGVANQQGSTRCCLPQANKQLKINVDAAVKHLSFVGFGVVVRNSEGCVWQNA